MMSRINTFLDQAVLPWPVKFLTHRFIILATICLLVPLVVFARATNFVLAVNSYLNTMSVAVSSIVLLYATIAEVRDKQTAARQEQRAQEDHQHVVEMHQMVLENMGFQHEEIQDLKQLLAQMGQVSVERTKLPHGSDADLQALHPRGKARFEKNHVRHQLSRQAPHALGDAIAALTVPPEEVS
jgi:hypothetical protein